MPKFDPAHERYVSLATFRRDGSEVKTPVWIANALGHYYVFSAGNAGKVKRIRSTARVRLAPCDVRGNLKGDWIEGTARIVDDKTTTAVAYRALVAKYGLQMRLLDWIAKITGRFGRRVLFEIDLRL